MHNLISRTAHTLKTRRQQAAQAYRTRRNPMVFFEQYGAAVEETLAVLWQAFFSDGLNLCLMATGGFGRGEMYPYSDVDLALVSAEPLTPAEQEKTAAFVQALWDMQLTPALKTGSISELCASAREDITGDTAFLEARFLCGSRNIGIELLERINLQRDTVSFIEAKLLEMQQRHAKSQGTGTVLEPNIKTCPGGLRDIHTMLWLAKAQGLDAPLGTLVSQGILTRTEAAMLLGSHIRLATIRIELHLAAGRNEDRLIFDLQSEVAGNLGWHNENRRVRSEKLMRMFYRACKTLIRLGGICQ